MQTVPPPLLRSPASIRRFTHPPSRAAARRGATLVETLIAIAIVVVALNIMAQMLFQAMDRATMARRRAQATLIAQERIEEILAHRNDLKAWETRAQNTYKPSTVQGMYSFPDELLSPYCWRWQIADFEGRPAMKEVSVIVRWRTINANWTPSFALRTLVAVPSKPTPEVAYAPSSPSREEP